MHAAQRLREKKWKSFINRENWIMEQLYKIRETGLNENMSHLLTKVMAEKSGHVTSRIRNSKKKPKQSFAAIQLISRIAIFNNWQLLEC